jgi:hypothetical protein
MDKLNFRFLILSSLVASLIFPLDLYLRFKFPEFLFLYSPIVGFWVAVIMGSIEENAISKETK